MVGCLCYRKAVGSGVMIGLSGTYTVLSVSMWLPLLIKKGGVEELRRGQGLRIVRFNSGRWNSQLRTEAVSTSLSTPQTLSLGARTAGAGLWQTSCVELRLAEDLVSTPLMLMASPWDLPLTVPAAHGSRRAARDIANA